MGEEEFDCLHQDYLEADALSRQVASALGDGFQPRTWDNGGWYWEVTKGIARVSPGVGQAFYCSLNFRETGGSTLNIVAGADKPEDALGLAVQQARTLFVQFNASLDALLNSAE